MAITLRPFNIEKSSPILIQVKRKKYRQQMIVGNVKLRVGKKSQKTMIATIKYIIKQ